MKLAPFLALCGRAQAQCIHRTWPVAATCVLLVLGCGDASGLMVAADAGTGAGEPTVDAGPSYAPRFTALYGEVLRPSCAWVFCHGGELLVDFATRERAYASMVGVAAEGTECGDSGLLRVVPGDPEASLLYLKVTEPPCGRRMPLMYDVSGMLADREIEQLRRWIELGARDD